MKTITCKIDNKGIYYKEGGCIPWSATNLPYATFRFRDSELIFWELAQIAYSAEYQCLKVEVVDFDASPKDYQPDRTIKRPLVALHFAPLEAEAFKAQLSYYQAGPLRAILQPSDSPPPNKASDTTELAPLLDAGEKDQTSFSKARTISFTFPILDLKFGNGGVTGQTELPGLLNPISFAIPNDHLVVEFNTIKPFFVRALKRKTIRATGKLIFQNDEPLLREVTSPQIAAINEDLLEIFRGRAVKRLLGSDQVKTVDKSLFTPEDVFDSLDDDELGKAVLPQNGQDLLAEILRSQQVRNARQLEFLAGRLHQPGTKLRFVLSPHFGFVFLAIGQEANHFILELLDSHATYVWSIPKMWQSLDDQYRAVEKEIAAIGQIGRSQYRRTLHFEHEFWYVVHEAAESGVVDGFPRWKNRVLEGLV